MQREEIQKRLDAFLPYLDGLHYEIAGSWRRGLSESKNVNILIDTNKNHLLSRVQLFLDDFPRDTGPEGIPFKELHQDFVSFNFLQLPFYLLCSRPQSWGAHLLYWTGSMVFTIEIRKRAKDRNMVLNRHGLFYNGELVAAKTEERIFYALELDYKKPEERTKLWD